MAIPNGPAITDGVSSSVWVPPPFSPGDGLQDVNIGVSVATPDAKDLTVSVAHGSTAVRLTGKHGAGTATTFDDEAMSPINGAAAPYAGSFTPDQPLSAFDTQAAQGVWKLTVKDTESPLAPRGRRDTPQTFVSWTLSFAAANCVEAQPPCDEHGTTSDIDLTNASATTTLQRVRGKGFVSDVDVYVGKLSTGGSTNVSLSVAGPGSAPARKLVTNRSVAAGAAFVGTVFDDSAAAAIGGATQPFTGRFTPEETLGTLNSSPVSSDYHFRVAKSNSAAVTLGSWGLRVLTSGCVDTDGDVIFDTSDNCEAVPNLDQADYGVFDDALGDACDDDDDGDGVDDTADRCAHGLRVFDPDGMEPDYDGDGCRNPEDDDDDDDGVVDTADGCPQAAKGPGGDTDGDGCKDFEDTDDDADGVADIADHCPLSADATQVDTDGDGAGDACDPDDDGDGVIDSADAFPLDGTRTAPPPTATPSPTPTATATATAPRVTALKLSKRRIKRGKRATLTYTVNAASTTRFTVSALKRCGKRKRCKPSVVRRRFTHVDKAAGRVKFVFKTKGLKKGRFRLQAVGSNAAGVSKAVSVTFRIV